ncbi:MAG: aminotransferase class I/II-fold pyridoxal phosphate-dependent enzyme [Bacteroidetes bacterium]|nr:aminotransferase class I/II-fold pyridoxal phosphate-dependent enzyme [Bacteroidota bacterium]
MKSKLPNIGTTIFTSMSALAKEHNAINLSQGFPDFECDNKLKELASKYIYDGANQYAPMAGTLQLRERIAEIVETCYKTKYDVNSEITVTAGATQAIYTAIATLINFGDEVIIFEPAYDCYSPAILVHGGVPIPIQLTAPDFKINWHEVKNKITAKTKCIIINTPHNPTATILNETDITELQKIVLENNLFLISDEVYEHMTFDNAKHFSIAQWPNLKERSIIVSSFGKTTHTTGWKIGYVLSSNLISAEFRKIHQYLVFCVNNPLQLALADYLKDENNYKSISNFYESKRNYFVDKIKKSRFKILPSKGTYFQLLDYSSITDENDTDYAIRLIKEHKIASIPLSVFYSKETNQKLLRFCFAKKDETLIKAAEILCSI